MDDATSEPPTVAPGSAARRPHATRAAVHRLEPAVRTYAWGSHTLLAELRGAPVPTDEPEAEAWFGAHPGAPARVEGDGTLLDLLDTDPEGQLGSDVADRFGERLPFLVKLLAAAEPLSLQAHPSADQAAAGFAAEEARGVPRDAATRTYRDPWPKPELLVALTPFAALCGFREVEATVDLLDRLAVAELRWLRDGLARSGEDGLPDLIARALRPRAALATELAALRPALHRLADAGGPAATEARWLGDLHDRYPHDGGVLVALLLRLVELVPGEAVHLPAGNLHAYLRGAGVEVMASSDNVVRGGLTAKHVDVEELLRVVDARVLPPPLVAPEVRDGWIHLPTPAAHFHLSHRRLDGEPVVLDRSTGGPEVLVAVGGDVALTADDVVVTLAPSTGAFVPASTRQLTAEGSGTVYRTTVTP